MSSAIFKSWPGRVCRSHMSSTCELLKSQITNVVQRCHSFLYQKMVSFPRQGVIQHATRHWSTPHRLYYLIAKHVILKDIPSSCLYKDKHSSVGLVRMDLKPSSDEHEYLYHERSVAIRFCFCFCFVFVCGVGVFLFAFLFVFCCFWRVRSVTLSNI